MKCLVFIPGIMGSELRSRSTGKPVWPPSVLQNIRKSLNIDELLDPDLEAVRPISSVAGFYSIYRSLLRDIRDCGYEVNGLDRRFIPFAYDWRQPNEKTAQLLSDRLDQETGVDEFVVIGHSMGGLIARHCIESGLFNQQTWFNKVTQVITMGTPHNGAPAALIQVSGLGANSGLKAKDVKRLADDQRYPSAYQLVPPASTAMVLKRANRHQLPTPLEPFSASIIEKYDLSSNNIEASKRFWSSLDIQRKPKHIDYYSFVGSAHKTLYRLDWNGDAFVYEESLDSGDGTVPSASCLNVSTPHSFSQKKHAKLFADRDVRVQLFRMLGAKEGVRPHSASGDVDMTSPTAMGMSTDREEYLGQDRMEVAVSYAMAQSNPSCRFQIVEVDPEGAATSQSTTYVGKPITVKFEGVDVSDFKFNLQLNLEPGVYELKASADMDDPDPSYFIVSKGDE